jgi:hypothetical protein
MRKGWDLREMETQSYKDLNLPKDFNHRKEDMFEKDNVFHNHKSGVLDSAEDDLDNINLNLQLELVDSAVTLCETYGRKKNKHKRVKNKRKGRIAALISEMYEECQGIEEDARGMGMLWRDLDGLDDEDFEDDKMRGRVEQELAAAEAREEREAAKEEEAKGELLDELSGREKGMFEGL